MKHPSRVFHPKRTGLGVVAVACALLLSACQANVTVAVDAHADGSGRVRVTATLDREAASQSGSFALDDLQRAGWNVDGPRPTKDGGAVLTVSHPFATPAEASRVVTSLSGPSGAFRQFRLTIHRSLLVTRSSFSGTVDLSAGLAAFADDDLRARLGGPGIGLDPAQVKDATGVDLAKLVSLQVSVDLPGSLTSSSPPAQVHSGATWRPQLGETLVLAASARRYNTTVIAYLVIGVVAALGALILARRRRRPSA